MILDHFCLTCDDCICLECAKISHPHHQISLISEIYELKKREILDLSGQCVALEDSLFEHAMQVKLIRDHVRERAKLEEAHYTNQIDLLISKLPELSMRLETIKQVFISEIEFQRRRRDNEMQRLGCLWLGHIEWMEDTSRFVNLISSRAPPQAFFRLFSMMKARMSALVGTASSFPVAEDVKRLDLEMKRPFELTSLIQNVSTIINQHAELQRAFESLPQFLTSVQINESS